MREPNEKPTLCLLGEDGNAFAIMGRAKAALRLAGADGEYIGQYVTEAVQGDYDHFLRVTMEYVNVQ